MNSSSGSMTTISRAFKSGRFSFVLSSVPNITRWNIHNMYTAARITPCGRENDVYFRESPLNKTAKQYHIFTDESVLTPVIQSMTGYNHKNYGEDRHPL